MPGLFVLLWATGFIGAKLGLPYAEPFTFLALRFILAIAIIAGIAIALGSARPTVPAALWSLAVGVLIHGFYLGGVFWAISRGMPAGIAAVVTGLQPPLTAVLAGILLSERVSLRQWTGFALGLIGVALVLGPKLDLTGPGVNPATIGACLAALFSITAGTILQKARAQGVPLWTGVLCQYAGALLVAGILAILFEQRAIEWTGAFVFALFWLTIVLSIGAISLLVLMLRRGAATRTAALFYLVPPVAAVLAYVLFGEILGPAQIAGMALTAVAVWLATRRRG